MELHRKMALNLKVVNFVGGEMLIAAVLMKCAAG